MNAHRRSDNEVAMRDAPTRPTDSTPAPSTARARRRHEALRVHGFRPAFYDHATARVYPSLDAHGLPAMDHAPECLPDEVVVLRTKAGRVLAVRPTLVAGYERGGYFFTSANAVRASRHWIAATA
jgi:hypothetical protein